MKKVILTMVIIMIITILAMVFLLTGKVRTDVYLEDFSISQDGKTMILNVEVSSSGGYIRKIKQVSEGSNRYYTFYSTFGINSKIGAKKNFEIEIDQNMEQIYFYTGAKDYKLVLIKDYIEGWKKINYTSKGTYKLELPKVDDIEYIGINTGAQDNNYFKYEDHDTIQKIYNIFVDLETTLDSLTFNPEDPEELYDIGFSDKNIENPSINTIISVYHKQGKYYAEQRYNGIYEISEEDFNVIRNYTE